MIEIYRPGTSPLHRLPPVAKLAALALAGTGLFFVATIPGQALALAAVLALYGLARLPPRVIARQIRALAPILLLIFAAQAIFADWQTGALVVLRLAALILLAGLLNLTTKASALIDALEHGLARLRPLGVSPEKVSLALSLTLRFVPVIAGIAAEVREAQAARGMEGNLLAVVVPTMLRSLRSADDIAAALDARGFDSEGSS